MKYKNIKKILKSEISSESEFSDIEVSLYLVTNIIYTLYYI